MSTVIGQPTASLLGLIHHLDRDSHEASHAYLALQKLHGMFRSMSRKGNCWDALQ